MNDGIYDIKKASNDKTIHTFHTPFISNKKYRKVYYK